LAVRLSLVLLLFGFLWDEKGDVLRGIWRDFSFLKALFFLVVLHLKFLF